MLINGEKVIFSDRALAGMAGTNLELRYYFSPPTSILDNLQRAEFVRIAAEAFGAGERNVRTWFSFNQRQTPFLRQDLDEITFTARVILAKCLLAVPYIEQSDRIERVLIKGVTFNPGGVPLAPLLREDYYYRDCFRWEFNASEWNSNEGTEPAEIASFVLIWYYGVVNVPAWLPEELRPEPSFESFPF